MLKPLLWLYSRGVQAAIPGPVLCRGLNSGHIMRIFPFPFSLFFFLFLRYTSDYTNPKSRTVEYENVRKMLKNKSRMITMRINPELSKLLDETIKKDKQFSNRNEFIEGCILKYLESKGKL